MGDATFSVDVVHVNGTTVVRFMGELDLAYVEHAEEQALRALGATNGGPLVIDLSELSYCDSSGIRALLTIDTTAAKRERPVVIRHPRPVVRRVFQIAGVDERLTIEKDKTGPPAA
jgi:anti-anti-sigma factor